MVKTRHRFSPFVLIAEWPCNGRCVHALTDTTDSPKERGKKFNSPSKPSSWHSGRGMKSMTGYGSGEHAQDGFKVTVELSSVNRKQSEISIVLPRRLEVLEAQMRDEINRRIARGRLTARVSLHISEGQDVARSHINRDLARAYARELARL